MKYFKLSEFERNNIKITDKNIEYNVNNLVNTILDKTREYYGKPIYILEGYNPNSNHMGHSIGIAAEITTKSKQGNIDIYEFIKTLHYDELSVNGDYESIHISAYPENRKQTEEEEEIIKPEKLFSDYLVCFDSGHGKDVAGKRSPDNSLLEWEWAREIKYRVIKEMEKQNIAECFDVNPEDTEPGLTVRANRANAAWENHKKKGIFVSIHINAAGNGQWMNARGWSVWTSVGQTEADILANYVWLAANEIFSPKNLTMRKEMSDGDYDYESNFTVLVKTKMPAILIENFFMDNMEDAKYLKTEEGKQDVVRAIVNGIRNYLRTKLN